MCCAAGRRKFQKVWSQAKSNSMWPQPKKVDQKMCYWPDFD